MEVPEPRGGSGAHPGRTLASVCQTRDCPRASNHGHPQESGRTFVVRDARERSHKAHRADLTRLFALSLPVGPVRTYGVGVGWRYRLPCKACHVLSGSKQSRQQSRHGHVRIPRLPMQAVSSAENLHRSNSSSVAVSRPCAMRGGSAKVHPLVRSTTTRRLALS